MTFLDIDANTLRFSRCVRTTVFTPTSDLDQAYKNLSKMKRKGSCSVEQLQTHPCRLVLVLDTITTMQIYGEAEWNLWGFLFLFLLNMPWPLVRNKTLCAVLLQENNQRRGDAMKQSYCYINFLIYVIFL